MTTIIGIQGDSFSLIAGDSRISDISKDGDVLQSSTLASGYNKVAVSKQFIIGVAGDLRAINLVQHAFIPPAPPAVTGKKLDAYMTVKFAPALRECFDIHGYAEKKEQYDSTMIVSVNGFIYVVDGDYSCMVDQTGLYAVGTGAQYALGALNALSGGKKLGLQQARRVALQAMAIASRYDPLSGAPYSSHTQEMPTPKTKVGKNAQTRTRTRSIR